MRVVLLMPLHGYALGVTVAAARPQGNTTDTAKDELPVKLLFILLEYAERFYVG